MATRRAVRKKKRFNLKRIINTFMFRSTFFDYSLLFIILFLVAFGLVIVYSTSSYTAQLQKGDPAYFLKHQAVAAVVGCIAMLIVANMDYHVFKKFSLLLMYGIIVMLVVVLIWGVASHGASRWLSIGGLSLQPSEFAKIIIILYTAHMCTIWAARIQFVQALSDP